MANVVDIRVLDSAVANAVAGVLNGLQKLQAAGIVVEMPEAIDLSFQVAMPDGINAIERTTVTDATEQTTTTENGKQVDTSVKGAETSTSKQLQGVQKRTETSQQDSNSTTTQEQNYGRDTVVTTVYN